jgi:hypothetical protein
MVLTEKGPSPSLADFARHFEGDFLQDYIRPPGVKGATLRDDEPLKGIHERWVKALGPMSEEAGIFHVRIVREDKGPLQRTFKVYRERRESREHLFTLIARELPRGEVFLYFKEGRIDGWRYGAMLLAWLRDYLGWSHLMSDHKPKKVEANCNGVPKRAPELAKWRATWKIIRSEVTTNGTDDLEFLIGLVKKHFDSQPDYNPKKNPVPSSDTLRKIRQAGIKGCLDSDKAP